MPIVTYLGDKCHVVELFASKRTSKAPKSKGLQTMFVDIVSSQVVTIVTPLMLVYQVHLARRRKNNMALSRRCLCPNITQHGPSGNRSYFTVPSLYDLILHKPSWQHSGRPSGQHTWQHSE
jgi:hypothetical protein